MRKPRIENKYNLKPKDIQQAIVLKPERLKEKPFWRNNVVQAWCLSEGVGKGYMGDSIDSYWIGFYDNDAEAYAGKIKLKCHACEDMYSYNFKTFFNEKEIENEWDLQLQEKLLERINWLIDEGIVMIPEKEEKRKKG